MTVQYSQQDLYYDEECLQTITSSPTMSLSSSLPNPDDSYLKLQNLNSLYIEGFITENEYTTRKSQIIEYFHLSNNMTASGMRLTFEEFKKLSFIPRPPPNWKEIIPQEAIKISYDFLSKEWKEESTWIKLDGNPFAYGGLRKAYHMIDLNIPGDTFVLKVSIKPDEDPDLYYRDVEMQIFAQQIAQKFNYCKPPKEVEFVKAWLVKLQMGGVTLCAVERFISGSYCKHNNNYGFVSEDERNTPQAFSHFSYEISHHQFLICDIQGVADLYTDPQIHSVSERFGKGNLGEKGINQFLKTHRCNPICRYLKLPPINPRYGDFGTVPDEHSEAAAYLDSLQMDEDDYEIFPNNNNIHYHYPDHPFNPSSGAGGTIGNDMMIPQSSGTKTKTTETTCTCF